MKIRLPLGCAAIALLLASTPVPSSGQILYSQLVSESPARFQLRQVNGDGSGDTGIGLPFADVILPAWSRDAGLFAISAPDPNRPNDRSYNIYTVNPANTAIQQITLNRETFDPQTGASQFARSLYTAFSPDRSRMAVSSIIVTTRFGQSPEVTCVLDIFSTATPTNLAIVRVYPTPRDSFTHHGGEGVDWHPTQNFLVAPVDSTSPYQNDPSRSGQVTALYLLEPVNQAVQQGRFQQITFPRTSESNTNDVWSEHDYQPKFSPNGAAVAYVRSFQNLSFSRGGADPNVQSLRILNRNTGADSEVIRLPQGGYVDSLDWSPDGTALVVAFGQQRSGVNGFEQISVPQTNELYVINVDGTGLRRLRGAGATTPAWRPLVASPQTPAGSNVTVRSPSGDASVTFPSVSQGGTTTFTPINPSSAGTPPQGFTILNNAPANDITTTAAFTGPVTVCHDLSSVNDAATFARVRILHSENGQLVDRTILSPDSPAPSFESRTVCARVDSLSPFVTALAPTSTPPPPNSSKLLNIATRMQVGRDPNQLIGGFIIDGSEPKKVIILATGPSLGAFGIQGGLADPVIELYQGNTVIASNDNWRIPAQAEIEATGVKPGHDLESALVRTLTPGTYTAVVRGTNGTGVGTVQLYDLSPSSKSKLANISSRGFVETADDRIMIAGFIIGGDGGANSGIVVRATAPSLSSVISGVLPDPTLELKDANGSTLIFNDDWQQSPQANDISTRGLAPSHPQESALGVSLSNGAYTAIVRGKNGTTGVAVVEVYNVD